MVLSRFKPRVLDLHQHLCFGFLFNEAENQPSACRSRLISHSRNQYAPCNSILAHNAHIVKGKHFLDRRLKIRHDNRK